MKGSVLCKKTWCDISTGTQISRARPQHFQRRTRKQKRRRALAPGSPQNRRGNNIQCIHIICFFICIQLSVSGVCVQCNEPFHTHVSRYKRKLSTQLSAWHGPQNYVNARTACVCVKETTPHRISYPRIVYAFLYVSI